MTMLTATELKSRLSEIIERAQREPITVKKGGKPYAVILGSEEYERLQAKLAEVKATRLQPLPAP